jgi:hypothetical protein
VIEVLTIGEETENGGRDFVAGALGLSICQLGSGANAACSAIAQPA